MSDEKKPDDSEPTPERQAELRAAYDANVAAGKAPYEHVIISTRGELSWIVRERDWSSKPVADGKARADLRGAYLNWATLRGAYLKGANLSDAHLNSANLSDAHLNNSNLSDAIFSGATLRGADLTGAKLRGAFLLGADLRGASLVQADLSGASLVQADLSGADLRVMHMNADTNLTGSKLNARTHLADIRWNGVPVTRLKWEDADTLGDEYEAHQAKDEHDKWEDVEIGDEWVARQAKDKQGKRKSKARRLRDFQSAVLANRQVATLLRSQGMNEDADRYAYRAQVLQRQVLWRQRHPLQALFSVFLDRLAGHGYKPGRTAVTYILAIFGFGIAYYVLGQTAGPHLSPLGAFVLSMTSFHGRGFFPGSIAVDDPLTVLAAFEAFVGLVIEASFIATFTQRYFAR